MKALRWFIGIFIVLVIAVLFVWNYIPNIISSKLSSEAKVPVKIETLNLSLNKIGLKGLMIGVPKGSLLSKSLSVNSLDILSPIKNYFHDHIVIDEIHLDNIYLGLEFEKKGSPKGNWSTIMGNLSEGKKETPEKSEKKEGKQKSVLIKKLVLTNIDIELVYKDSGSIRKLRPIKRIELYNVSSTGGLPTSQIMDIIMQQMLRNVFSKEGMQHLLQDVLNPSNKVEQVFDNLKGLFSKDETLLDEEAEQESSAV